MFFELSVRCYSFGLRLFLQVWYPFVRVIYFVSLYILSYFLIKARFLNNKMSKRINGDSNRLTRSFFFKKKKRSCLVIIGFLVLKTKPLNTHSNSNFISLSPTFC